MKNIPEMSKEIFVSSLEMLQKYEVGTPEFEFAFQMITVYKIYMDSKAGRIVRVKDDIDNLNK
jgi:hypothetical protein